MPTLEGSCLCGAVRYRYHGALGPIAMCHCGQCRKAQGTAFATNSPIDIAAFELIAGNARLREFASSPGKLRAFCGDCGSPIYSRREDLPGVLRLRIGTLETPIDARPSHHIYAGSRAEREVIDDGLPQYAALENGPRIA